ncbi:MAG TPA: thioesterase II family protein [Pyrinomonadaceae bacterium]|nr:thioesterase II family protein [Pyrinomonadaceae bacterium]
MPIQAGTMTQTANPWLYYFKPNPKASVRLFCFHYAGGNALIYRTWAQKLPPSVEVVAIQLPGRATRMHQPLVSKLTDLVEPISEALAPLVNKPFAFFGHSMGALILFEVTRFLRRQGRTLPLHLFVSGRSAPQLNREHSPLYNLPKDELLAELQQLDGTPREVLEHPELMELMLPMLRADFSICDTYEYTEEAPLACPITAFGGLQDFDVSRRRVEAWREQTSATFTLRMFAGNHFFIHSNETLLLNLLATQLGLLQNL